jgi:hypothetical protein
VTDTTLIEVPGVGFTNTHAEKINAAVQRYDQYLRFGFNPANGDWILYVIMPRAFDSFYRIGDEPVYPVIGFGYELPTVDHVMERVRSADVRKRGKDVYQALLKHNAEVKAKGDLILAGAIEEAAERIEHFTRKAGFTEKYGKVTMHVPKTRARKL